MFSFIREKIRYIFQVIINAKILLSKIKQLKFVHFLSFKNY